VVGRDRLPTADDGKRYLDYEFITLDTHRPYRTQLTLPAMCYFGDPQAIYASSLGSATCY
jgi:hypothetical protein